MLAQKPKPIKVLLLTNGFPNLLQSWFLNQIFFLRKIGCNVWVATIYRQKQVANSVLIPENWQSRLIVVPSKRLAIIRAIFPALANFIPTLQYYNAWGASGNRGNLFGKWLIKSKFAEFAISRHLLCFCPEIIHAHSEFIGLHLFSVIDRLRVPFVVTFHGLQPKGVPQLNRHLMRTYFVRADIILVNTNFAAKQIQIFDCPEDKIRIIPQGIKLDDFPFMPAKRGQGTIFLLTVARYDYYKGLQYAIMAVKLLVDQGIDIEYNLVGNGLYWHDLSKLIIELGLENKVKLVGLKSGDELRKYYQQSHIFILPSIQESKYEWAETQGVVLQEAQATGLITIAAKTGGIPECINDGNTGFLVEQKNPNAIAEKVRYVINNDSKWNEWQKKARRWVEDRYDINIVGRQLTKIYEELIGSS